MARRALQYVVCTSRGCGEHTGRSSRHSVHCVITSLVSSCACSGRRRGLHGACLTADLAAHIREQHVSAPTWAIMLGASIRCKRATMHLARSLTTSTARVCDWHVCPAAACLHCMAHMPSSARALRLINLPQCFQARGLSTRRSSPARNTWHLSWVSCHQARSTSRCKFLY